jgi:DICT domain-containing protein
VALDAVETLADAGDGRWRSGATDPNYRALLQYIDETDFESYDRHGMLGDTREIETRAWRAGSGTLHAGFQSLAAFDAQSEVYADLAGRGVDIHVYGRQEWESAAPPDVGFHSDFDDERSRFWFVVYDAQRDADETVGVDTARTPSTGDGAAGRDEFARRDRIRPDVLGRGESCAIVGQEREEGQYRGFWTYNPDRVSELVAVLDRARVRPD